jgi:hypothetical protein
MKYFVSGPDMEVILATQEAEIGGLQLWQKN